MSLDDAAELMNTKETQFYIIEKRETNASVMHAPTNAMQVMISNHLVWS